MSYAPPAVTATGLTIPSYQDIVGDLVAHAQQIYGADVYLGVDSADYQMVSVFASKVYDTMLLLQSVYNARSPSTAIGAALDAVVSLNGIQRVAGAASTCPVVLSGTAGTTISAGLIADQIGNTWALPGTVQIGADGSVTVTATCQTAGPIPAAPGTIATIVTPTLGWASVTNTVAATVGTSTETDSALRARQAVSTAQPSQTVLEGVEGAIAAVAGVTRYVVYENDTASADSHGNPPHSITAIVEGGSDAAVATAIWQHKGIGPLANGTTQVPITDSAGVTATIGFDRPAYVQVDVTVNLTMLPGYTSASAALIQAAIASYLNSMSLGSTSVTLSALWAVALSVMPSLTNPTFSITGLTAALHGQAQGTADIPLSFAQVPQGVPSFVAVVPH